MNKKQKKVLYRIIIGAMLVIVSVFLKLKNPWGLIFIFIPYLIVGYDILIKAVKGVKNLQPLDECFLMSVATIGAMILGEYTEGVAVMLFYQVGELFQSYAVGKSRKSISQLMDIRPDYANVEVLDETGKPSGNLEMVDPDDVETGTIIVVKPGEKIPIDGIVVEGRTTLNTSALTGESLPKDVEVGNEVISGCININGLIKVRTTKEFGESTASQILDMVENASSKKSSSEKFISKFARYYTPIVCYSALFLAILPPIIRMAVMGIEPNWSQWIYRALTFLVISCPCALVISVPLGFFAGIGGASNAGVLVKGANYLEALSKVKTIVFDKTGTLTKGIFQVIGIHHGRLADEKLLEFAALAESYSTHPIGVSILKEYKQKSGKEIDKSKIIKIDEVGGQGVVAILKVDSEDCDFKGQKEICLGAGNSKLMKTLGVENFVPCTHVGTVVHLAIDGNYAGHILISDVVKEDAKSGIQSLKKIGIKNTIMLTGDIKKVGEKVAEELGLDEVYSQLLPQDKVQIVENLLEKQGKKEKLAFVGDGINDAPVLSRADVGIAMGALGSDAAIEAADVVLMDDNPLKIAKAIKISKKCMKIVYENIYFAIGLKILCLFLGALGIADMWFAIFADVGVMVLAVLNAIRALGVKNL